jgi:hypothetical protein
MFENSYKHIQYKDNYVYITHYVLEEYEEETSNPELTFQIYMDQTIQSYELAYKLDYCEIINISDESIEIKMKKYEILWNNIDNFKGKNPFIKKFCKLLEEMYLNKIVHLDFAPRNIGIDLDGDFKLIDLNDIYEFKEKEEFINFLSNYQFEFNHTGLGNKYQKACNIFTKNLIY